MSTLVLRSIAAALCLVALPMLAQEPPRPKVGLVLSGGGARGLAHIGVLKVLRDQRVPVDFIVATSMGSIVGGAYAAGLTPEEMEKMAVEADWDLMFSDRPPREHLHFRRKEDDRRLVGRSELGIKRDGLTFPRGAFGAQNLEEFLRAVSRPAAGARTLDDLPILFRAVATDLETGDQVVLSDVPLPLAMRASMSVPGAFAPTQVNGRLLADGGLVRNLPVEVAREMGADVIIAVNVGTPLLPREALGTAFGVAQQMVNILTEQNVGISLNALRHGDILISPDLRDVTFVDFERGAELVERGVAAGREVALRLAALTVDSPRYARYEAQRTRPSPNYGRPVARIEVAGAQRVNPDALRNELASRAGIEVGQPVTDEQMVTGSRVIHGLGEFERAQVSAHLEEGRKVVVIDVDEKPWGPDYLRLGGRAVADFRTDGRFSVNLQHTRTWLNGWGAEWVNEVQFGDVRRFATALYQPLGPGSRFFVEGLLQSTKSDFDVFGNGFRRTDRMTNTVHGALAGAGMRVFGNGVARLQAGYERYRTAPAISSRIDEATRDSATFQRVGLTFDTLDDPNFPRRGYLVEADYSRYAFRSEAAPLNAYLAQALLPATFGRLTFLAILTAAHASDSRGGFGLGGFLNLSGTPPGAISGAHALGTALLAYYRIAELPRALGRSIYAGVSAEAGNAWDRRSQVSLGDTRKAGSLFLALDTNLGAMYFGYGRTAGGADAFYVFLGRPGER
ncbi:MAG TPA: patatin-like phospholipase family protein [Usitatibacter sp.]|nr:patatin-like phospholipase family protein [Usitatibacter sp.]